MPHKSLLPETVSHYVNQLVLTETDVQKRLRERTRTVPHGGMQVSIDQGRLLSLLVKMIGAKRAVEVGTFTGYSALCIASSLPADGKLTCCDVSDEWTSVGKPFWAEAGVAGRIDLRIAPAIDTLKTLIQSEAGKVDFVFIDADKAAYPAYYDACLQLLRPGGVMVLDNMLRGGRIADADADPDTVILRDLTLRIRDDARVDMSLLTVGDGFVVVRKR